MKHLVLIVAILLLLSGCKAQPPAVTVPTVSEPAPTVTQLTCVDNSDSELMTSGAVCLYDVADTMQRIELLDTGLLIIDAAGTSMLISEEDAVVKASDITKKRIIDVSENWIIGTLNSNDRTVVVLDNNLTQTTTFPLEENASEELVVSNDEIFYMAGDFIRAYNLESHLTRDVIQYVSENEQKLIDCYFDGEFIGWRNSEVISLISSVDGQVVPVNSELLEFYTGTDTFLALCRDGQMQQYLCGTRNENAQRVVFGQDETVYPQLNCDAVVTMAQKDDRMLLRRYSIPSGVCTGEVETSISGDILDVVSSERYTWILTNEGLYRWDYTVNRPDDLHLEMSPLSSEENPDIKALEACTERAKSINERYGIEVHIWQDALLNDDSYVITPEYQTDIINKMLDDVEAQLKLIPDQILKRTDEYCGFQICLVRSIQGSDFVQYLVDGGFCLAVTPEADMQEAILTGLGWGIDSCVMGNSRDLDYWDDLNPSGFDYDYSYYANKYRTDLEYLDGNYKAFVDQRAMSFPSEDRARIFYYAMTEGNADLFTSPILQKKLKTFCEGIREAYGWQKVEQSFPWEQYLETSLAYKK